jgi:hypothetical protein
MSDSVLKVKGIRNRQHPFPMPEKPSCAGKNEVYRQFKGALLASENFFFNFIRNQNMNDVIFYLWLADIVSATKITTGILLMGGVILSGALLVAFVESKIQLRWLVLSGVFSVVMLAVTVLTPAPRTLEVLAATQAVDIAVTTELGEKAVKALHAILDRMITLRPKAKKESDDIF